jgi:hypothetical protein
LNWQWIRLRAGSRLSPFLRCAKTTCDLLASNPLLASWRRPRTVVIPLARPAASDPGRFIQPGGELGVGRPAEVDCPADRCRKKSSSTTTGRTRPAVAASEAPGRNPRYWRPSRMARAAATIAEPTGQHSIMNSVAQQLEYQPRSRTPGTATPRWNAVPGALSPTRRRLIRSEPLPDAVRQQRASRDSRACRDAADTHSACARVAVTRSRSDAVRGPDGSSYCRGPR